MGAFIVRRVLWMFVTLFAVSLITFVLMHLVPGGPFASEKKLPPAVIENINRKFRLDQPLYKQYFYYAGDILVPRYRAGEPDASRLSDYLINIKIGDGYFQWMNFGPSYASKTRTVNDIFRENLPISAQLGLLALAVGLVIGMPLGTIAALRQNTAWDYAGMAVAIFGVSVPVIVLGPLLIWIFGVQLRWFPVSGWGEPKQMVMPALALGLGSSAIIARLTRASLLQVIREDYIRTARAKGLSERVVIIKHALKNALIPVATVLGPLFAGLVTGSFVTETIFGIPGLGRYFVSSITNRDYTVIMGTILLFATLLVLANLVVDIMYAFLDPRVRLS